MKRLSLPFVLLLVVVFWATANSQPSLSNEPQKAMVLSNLSSMLLSFTENRGQWDEKALFKAEAGGATFWFCKDEVVYQFTRDTDELFEDGMPHGPKMPDGMPDKFDHPRYKKESMVLRAQFVGANLNPEISGADRLSHNNNYFLGNIPSKWATDVPNWSSVTYKNIYPSIDLKYHGDGKGMKYDFIVNPGADISQIKIRYEGVDGLSVTSNGDLEADTRFGPVKERIPRIYQEIEGQNREIKGKYILRESGIFGFAVEDGFNPAYPIVIDPQLVYCTYLGGTNSDLGYGITVDVFGNAYVTGETGSTNFPVQNPYQADQPDYDVFVSKLSPAGNFLVYSTYLGGGGYDQGWSIAVDGTGNAYVAGATNSTNFPTQNFYQANQPDNDAFVTKLSPSGNSLIYSTYLGGGDTDYGWGIGVDGSCSAYITGGNTHDAFVAKFEPQQDSLGRICGTVVDNNNIPVPGVLIYAREPNWNRHYVSSDSTGHFCIDSLAPGSYYLNCSHHCGDEIDTNATVNPGMTTVLNFNYNLYYRGIKLYVSTTGDDFSGNGMESNPFATIGHALDIAVCHDTILVEAGTYTDLGTDGGHYYKEIVLLAISGPESTIVDLGNVRPATGVGLGFGAIESLSIVVDGFTFSNFWRNSPYTGALYCPYGTPIFRNCIFKDCTTGVFAPWGSPIIENCTFVNNDNAVFAIGGGAPLLINDLMWNNISYGLQLDSLTNAIVIHCNIQDSMWPGQGNISCDPAFCDADSGNFRLSPGSCCAGAGQGGANIGALGVGCEDTQQTGSIAGGVWYICSGQPLQGILVQALGTDISDLTDGSGSFHLTGLPEGSYNVRFSHQDYRDTTITGVQVMSGQPTNLSVYMLHGDRVGHIAGEITDENGNPIRWIFIQTMPPSDCGGHFTESSGKYCIDSLMPGTYNILAHNECYDDTTINNISVALHDTTILNIIMPGHFRGIALHVSSIGDDATGDGSILNPFASIQNAINHSVCGDTILVASGNYLIEGNGNDLSGKRLVIMSEHGPDSTLIDFYPQSGNNFGCFWMLNGEDESTVIDGFTISGHGNSDGIHCQSSSPIIRNCNFQGDGQTFFGIYSGEAYPSISNCLFTANTSHGAAGIVIGDGGANISNCTVAGISSIDYAFGIIVFDSWASIKNSILWNDSNPDSEIYIYSQGEVTVEYCDVHDTLWLGQGNISCDPMFCNGDSGNYHLNSNSCCISTGQGGANIGALGVGCGNYSAPILSLSSHLPFNDSISFFPPSGDQNTRFEFRINYRDSLNNAPQSGYPRLVLDWDGDGIIDYANDGYFPMAQSEADTLFTNGADYSVFKIIPAGGFPKMNFEAMNSQGRFTTFPVSGWINGPVIVDPYSTDLYLYADDITYSTYPAQPAMGEPFTIFARVHNNSSMAFDSVSVNMYIEGALARSYKMNLPARDSHGVPGIADISLDTLFNSARFLQVEVRVDPNNSISEWNEGNNSAMRSLLVGNYELPSDIVIDAVPLASYYPTTTVSGGGSAWYEEHGRNIGHLSGTPVYIRLYGGNVDLDTVYVDDNGNFNYTFQAPLYAGSYNIRLVVTDFTITDTVLVPFHVIPPPAIGPNLIIDYTLNGFPLNTCTNHLQLSNPIIYNIGNRPSATCMAKITHGSETVLSSPVPALEPGNFYLMSHIPFTITDATPGNYSISGIVDYLNEVQETSEGDNSRYSPYYVWCCPEDLNPSEINLTGTIYKDIPVNIPVRVFNRGGVASNDFDLRFTDTYRDTTVIIGNLEHLLLPGFDGNQWYTFPNYALSDTGWHEVRVIADPQGEIAECREDNNIVSRSIYVRMPMADLYTCYDSIMVDNPDAHVGDPVTFKAKIWNLGNSAATNIGINFRVNSEEYTSAPNVDIAQLAPGTGILVQHPTEWIVDFDKCPLQVFADFGNAILESNEGNNYGFVPMPYDFQPAYGGRCSDTQYPRFFNVCGAYTMDPVTINLTARNFGIFNFNDSLTFNIYDSLAGTNAPVLMGSRTVLASALHHGRSLISTNFTYNFPNAGIHFVTVKINPDQVVKECNYSNNQTTYSIEIQSRPIPRPDITINSEWIVPSAINPDLGDTFSIRNVDVYNIGDTTAYNVGVRFTANGQQLGNLVNIDSIPNHGPNNYRSVQPTDSVIVENCNPRARIFEVCSDPSDSIQERNEQNNCASKSIIFCESPELYIKAVHFLPALRPYRTPVDLMAIIADSGGVSSSATIEFSYLSGPANDWADTILIGSVPLQQIAANTDTTKAIIPWIVESAETYIYVEIVNPDPRDYFQADNDTSVLYHYTPWAPGTLTGFVTSKKNNSPIGNASITLSLGGSQFGPYFTGADGWYCITGLTGGSYHMEINHPDYQTWRGYDIYVYDGQLTPLNIKMLPPPSAQSILLSQKLHELRDAVHNYIEGDMELSSTLTGKAIYYLIAEKELLARNGTIAMLEPMLLSEDDGLLKLRKIIEYSKDFDVPDVAYYTMLRNLFWQGAKIKNDRYLENLISHLQTVVYPNYRAGNEQQTISDMRQGFENYGRVSIDSRDLTLTYNQVLQSLDNSLNNINIPPELPESYPVNDLVSTLNAVISNIQSTHVDENTTRSHEVDSYWHFPGKTAVDRDQYVILGSLSTQSHYYNNILNSLNKSNKIKKWQYFTCNPIHWIGIGAKLIGGATVVGSLPIEAAYITINGICAGIEMGNYEYKARKLKEMDLFCTTLYSHWPDEMANALNFYDRIIDDVHESLINPTFYSCQSRLLIDDFTTPNICVPLGRTGSEEATVRLTNLNNSASTQVRLFMNIYVASNNPNEDEKLLKYYDVGPFIIGPGETFNTTILYEANVNSVFSLGYDVELVVVNSGLGIARDYSWFNCYNAEGCILSPLSEVVDVIQNQTIHLGERVVQDFTPIGDAVETKIELRWPGSDVDLHIYDYLGNHVGINYITGEIETQIPGAQYYDDSSHSAWVTIPNCGGRTYRVEAIGVEMQDSSTVAIKALVTRQHPAVLGILDDEIIDSGDRGDTVTFDFQLVEIGGQLPVGGINIEAGQLSDSLGNIIPSSNISFSFPSDQIDPSGHMTVEGRVYISPGCPYGIYTGTIHVNSNAQPYDLTLDIKVFSKNNIITGLVMDENMHPITNAYVTSIGTTSGDSTASNGSFILDSLELGIHNISITHVGYRDTIIADVFAGVGDTTTLNIVMERSSICDYTIGDANNSNTFTGLDVTYSVRYFKGGPHPPYSCDCPPHGTWYVSGDVNGSCSFTGLDITMMVRHFKTNAAVNPCSDCPPGGLLAPPAPGEVPTPAVQPILKPTLKAKGVIKADSPK